MGLLLEDEADCLNHQHKHRRHRRPIRRQSWAAAPYRASGLVPSAIADIDGTASVRRLRVALLPFAQEIGMTRKPCRAEGSRSRTYQRVSDTPYWV